MSPDLRDLLLCLLRRNSKDRISYESFFVHRFLQGKKAAVSPGEPSQAANLRRRVSKSGVLPVDMPPLGGTPPAKAKSPLQQQLEQELKLVKLAEQQQKEREEQEAQEDENTGRCSKQGPQSGISGHKNLPIKSFLKISSRHRFNKNSLNLRAGDNSLRNQRN